jgi:molybdopterin synthase catalytic subunit
VGERRAAGSSVRLVQITERAIDSAVLARLLEATASPADGAQVVFIGRTRETPGTAAPGQEAEAARHAGQRVRHLEYEAFESMALDVIDEIAAEVEVRFGVRRLAVVHRVGAVPVGEPSVAIVAGAPHRDAAFDACRHAIDELKARVPIWKAEHFDDGSVWMGAPARDRARPQPETAG